MDIKDMRKERGLTQKQVAEKAGLSESAVCLIEKGKRNPSLRIAYKIASALGVTLDELAGKGEGN